VRQPGLFANHDDKALVDAIRQLDAAAIDEVGRRVPRLALAAATISGFVLLQHEQDDEARSRLQWVFASGKDPANDPFISEYVTIRVSVAVVDGATASLPTDRTTVGLILAELLQRADDLTGAIDVVEQLEPTTLTALSLAELDASAGRYDEVVQVTEGCENVDDATSLLCTFRGVALREQGHFTAARACFADALRSSKRDPAVRHRAWFERSKCYLAEGQRSRARQDLERILAEDSDYEGLARALAALEGLDGVTSKAGSA
jgi:tetratricopeptide (TPR) repeat protein